MTQAELQRMTTEVAKALRSRLPKDIAIVIYLGNPSAENLGAMNSDIPIAQLPGHLRSLANQIERGK